MSTTATADEKNGKTHGEPYDGMMCLCTMEDITLEDGNYVEYQSYPSMKWKPCLYEKSIVEKLLSEQFTAFVEKVKTADCQAELRRLLAKGPPIWLADEHALPLEEGETHVVKLWFADTNQEVSAKLDGALEGPERQKLWDELQQFLSEDVEEEEKNEGAANENKDAKRE